MKCVQFLTEKLILSLLPILWGLDFPGSSDGKASACNAGDLVLSLDQEDPRGRKWQPTPVLFPGKSYGWRNLVGYSPWSPKESDTTAISLSLTSYSEDIKSGCVRIGTLYVVLLSETVMSLPTTSASPLFLCICP